MRALHDFGKACAAAHLAPRPLLPRSVETLRAHGSLDLSYCGIGDSYARALAVAIPRFGARLKSLELRDNRLLDEGVHALVQAAQPHYLPRLLELDISVNKLGPQSAQAIRDLLQV